MNENELYVVREYKFYNPITSEIDSIVYKCFRDCLNRYFHKFNYECIFDIRRTISLKLK